MTHSDAGKNVTAGESSQPSVVIPFAYGFRPFFLLAGIYSIVPVATLYLALTTGAWPDIALSPFAWHGHELVFGFASAAIAGFLLTAVPTWTDTKTVSGIPLACLVLVWIAARIASSPWVETSHGLGFAPVLSAAFFPVLTVTIAVPLVRTRNVRNLPFILLLAALSGADLVFQVGRFGQIASLQTDGMRLAINTLMLMIVIIGGRITPAFTRNALILRQRDSRMRNQSAVDIASAVCVVGVLLGDWFARDSAVTGLFAALCAAVLLVRLSGWGGLRTLDMPLLWVLHLGFCWLVLALSLKGLWLLGGFSWAANWMHAFTAGAFGTMILGVMTRVALGHTGRPLVIPPAVTAAYILISVAAILRVFGTALMPDRYLQVLGASIACWILAFLIFLVIYTPILLKARVDGKPG